jgi:hypothetical protein
LKLALVPEWVFDIVPCLSLLSPEFATKVRISGMLLGDRSETLGSHPIDPEGDMALRICCGSKFVAGICVS